MNWPTGSSVSQVERWTAREDECPDEEMCEIGVMADRLDAVAPPDLPIAFVRIEVEGAELQVLRGGVDTIRRWRPFIVFEDGRGSADHYGTTPAAVYDLLAHACGLRVALLARLPAGQPAPQPRSNDA